MNKRIAVALGLMSSLGWAKEPYGIRIKKEYDTASIIAKMESNKIVVFGKEWNAITYCNEETVLNPDTLEAYSFRNNGYELALICPGSLDGEVNTVSVFSPRLPPQTKRVMPISSSNRIGDDVLAKTILELTGKSK